MIINEEWNWEKKDFEVAWYNRRVKMTHGKEIDEGV
jgi:hypothetical protein